MRIKLFENFGAKPVVLDSFQEAEGKLSNKTGIVLSLTGDITDIEEVIKDIPHKEAYVLITDQSSQVASSWKSDVFLVGAGETLTMASGTKNFPNFRELYNAMTIKQYFDEEWTDPAGGVHRGDDEDPAAMYEALADVDFGGILDKLLELRGKIIKEKNKVGSGGPEAKEHDIIEDAQKHVESAIDKLRKIRK